MTKARTLANFISDGSTLADGAISVSEVSGAAPLASPSFTGNLTVDTDTLYVNSSANRLGVLTSAPDAELHISSSHPHIDLGPKGSNRAKLGFRYDNLYLGATAGGGEVILKNNISSTDAPDASGDEIARFGDTIVFNEGSRDQDFRVESNNSEYMLYLDGGQDTVGIKTNATDAALNVNSQSNSIDGIRVVGSGGNNFITGYGNQGNISFSIYENGADDPGTFKLFRNGTESVIITADENTTTVFNEQGENNDFRVESADHSHMLFVDASQNTVGIGEENSPSAGVRLHVSKNDASQYSSDGTVIQNDVPVKIQNLNTTTNLVMSGIHIRSGTWDGGVVGVPTGNGNTNNGYLALVSEGQEGVRIYNDGAQGGTVFNEPSFDRDFRVESDGNANMLFVDAGNNEVGVGTSNPDATMHVYGSLTVGKSGVSEDHDLKMWPSTAGRSVMGFRNQDNYMALMSGDPLSTDLFTVTTGGRGSFIGGLTVNESGAPAEDFRVESDNNANMLLVDAENDRVKIGSSTGSAHFNVVIADSSTDPLLGLFQQQTDGKDARIQINTQANDGGDPYLKLDAGGSNMIVGLNWHGTTNNKLKLGAAERPSDTIKGITISGLGDVSSSATGYEGSLDSTDTGKLGHRLGRTGSHIMQRNANSTGAESIIVNNIHSSGASIGMLQYRTRNSVEGSLNGNSSGLVITNNSDYRKKENITDATGCLTKITGLRPVTYTHRSEYDTDTTTVHTGFIAHEVSDHMPSIVGGAKDAVDDEGNAVLQSVAYSSQEIITNLVGAIKELEARITALENA